MERVQITQPTLVTRKITRCLHHRADERTISQTELTRAIGSNQSPIQRWLTGEQSIPLEHFLALCDALDLHPGTVIDDAHAAS
ncbi:helix-turn-helix domain-containing protein [Calidifontibacter indicus]|uniref:helix-turn-helix domain-containing protein n=1 Tax=Calidifontibacter indicus TaxID=419650 RepID=UPI003D70479B